MSRRRATLHCGDCQHHAHQGTPRAAHYCGLARVKMSHDNSRTSPPWCPLGHVVPGVPYPMFSPGKDPDAERVHISCHTGLAGPVA